MTMPSGRDRTINDVIKSIDDGVYRIPRFQRDFVWDIKKSAALIDSIFKGFPIGSVLLWRTKNELSDIKNMGGIEIPNRDPSKYTFYVIDGQQRLTSLYFALKGLVTTSGSDFSKMCISLLAERGEQLVFETLPKDASMDDFVILKDLATAKGLSGEHAEKRLEYYQILLQYTISIIEIDDDGLGLEDVIEVFERLNLGGKKLNLFSIISARSYKPSSEGEEGFDLTQKYKSFNEHLNLEKFKARIRRTSVMPYGIVQTTFFISTWIILLILSISQPIRIMMLVSGDLQKYINQFEMQLDIRQLLLRRLKVSCQ